MNFNLLILFPFSLSEGSTNYLAERKRSPQPYLSQAFHSLKYPTEKSALVAHTPLDICYLLFLLRVEVRLRNEHSNIVSHAKHGAKVQLFLKFTRQYAVKVSKKTRFGRFDVDRTEEFGDFEAIVCGMMRSRNAETWHLHRKVGTRSAKGWLLGRSEAMRRAQRRQMYGAEATNSAKERGDNGSDFNAARIVIKLCRYDLLTTRIIIKSYYYNLFATRFVIN